MKEKLTELIKQAKYCTAEELAEYLVSAGLVLPTRCKDCDMYCPESITVVKHCTLTGLQTDEDDFCTYGGDFR